MLDKILKIQNFIIRELPSSRTLLVDTLSKYEPNRNRLECALPIPVDPSHKPGIETLTAERLWQDWQLVVVHGKRQATPPHILGPYDTNKEMGRGQKKTVIFQEKTWLFAKFRSTSASKVVKFNRNSRLKAPCFFLTPPINSPILTNEKNLHFLVFSWVCCTDMKA